VTTVGETAMHGAAYAQFPSVVKYLDAHGAKIEVWNQPNKHGWTPLRIAEGHRFGNFKPDFDTVAAVKDVMRAHGAEIPPPMKKVDEKGYQ
jgi:ankyrin repeat protein